MKAHVRARLLNRRSGCNRYVKRLTPGHLVLLPPLVTAQESLQPAASVRQEVGGPVYQIIWSQGRNAPRDSYDGNAKPLRRRFHEKKHYIEAQGVIPEQRSACKCVHNRGKIRRGLREFWALPKSKSEPESPDVIGLRQRL